jgi:hypothetical protein
VAAIATVAATFARAATIDGSCGEDGFASAICAALPAEESARKNGQKPASSKERLVASSP